MVDKLKACLSLRKQINDINDKIYELQSIITSPKNQIITGMPHAGGRNDVAADRYLIRLEELEERRKKFDIHIKALWCEILPIFEQNNIKPHIVELFWLRFYNGLSWNKCAEVKQWNTNKCFRVYRTTLGKINKKSQ